MYELGLAHAVKSPARVLIVRDDSEKLLFDVTSIPHVQIDFSDLAAARMKVGTLLDDRIKESVQIQDIKLASFVGSMSESEAGIVVLLWELGACPIKDIRMQVGDKKMVPIPMLDALRSLRAEGLIRSHLQTDPFTMFYSLTERGKEAALVLVKSFQAQAKKTK